MAYVIKIEWLGGTIVRGEVLEGSYVQSYDPDAYDGCGDVTGTMDKTEAKRFEHAVDAMDYYRQVSKVRPTRTDGKPNRPLTAFTVSIEPIDE